MYLNKVIIVGNLTRDPELTAIPSGQKVCKFGVATNRVWKDKSGAKQESTSYHNVVVWGRQAETSAQYLKKGQQVMIEGRIETRSWDDKTSGEKKYRTEIIADRVQFGAKSGGASTGTPNTPSAKTSSGGGEVDTIEYPEEDISPEDIPF
ncbi:MAG: single-stranded DNA-binding protein [Candidatus Nomurabacteria bacterium]|nr:single-stranded DNA-binding protein [Candidatus Nomurabacteria bacterium]